MRKNASKLICANRSTRPAGLPPAGFLLGHRAALPAALMHCAGGRRVIRLADPPADHLGAAMARSVMVDKWNSADGQKVRLQCFKRDKAANAPCWICKDPIDYTRKPSSHPDAWEPDHYLDRKTHPELALDPNNIRASHARCNRSRKTKASIANLGKQSRDWKSIY